MTDTKISALPELLTPATGDVLPITHLGTTYKIQEQNLVPAQVNADWNAVSGIAQILNKPQLAQSITNVLHKWLNSYNATTGAFTQTQPDYSDLTSLPQLAQTSAAAANKFLTAYDATTGLFTNAQPDWSNLTNIPSTFPIATPGTLTVSTSNNASGAHTHAITSSNSPGAIATILATGANGNLILSGQVTGGYALSVNNAQSISQVLDYGAITGHATLLVSSSSAGKCIGGYFDSVASGTSAANTNSLIGLYCNTSSSAATAAIPNAYSLYVDGPTATGAGITNKYGIYQVTASINNYFASPTNFNAGINIAGGTVYTAISANPGAAAAILASDASGLTQVVGLGAGVAGVANELRASSGFRSNSVTGMRIEMRTIANLTNGSNAQLLNVTGTAAGTIGFIFVIASEGTVAMYDVDGGQKLTHEGFDPWGVYTPTATTASSTNLYYSNANSRYEIENNRGVTLTYNVVLLVNS